MKTFRYLAIGLLVCIFLVSSAWSATEVTPITASQYLFDLSVTKIEQYGIRSKQP